MWHLRSCSSWPYTGTSDDTQPRRFLDQVGIDLDGRADEERFALGEVILVSLGVGLDHGPARLGCKQIEAGLSNWFCNENLHSNLYGDRFLREFF